MRRGRFLLWALAPAALAALAGCGHRFAFGEQLLPESYGPPFGSALKQNLPEHPHLPADEERHAAADSEKNKRYRSHQACHAALSAAVLSHGGAERDVVRISSIESLGHYRDGDIVHEHRCTDYVLSHRSWCAAKEQGDGHGEGHGEAHGGGSKRAAPACGAGETSH